MFDPIAWKTFQLFEFWSKFITECPESLKYSEELLVANEFFESRLVRRLEVHKYNEKRRLIPNVILDFPLLLFYRSTLQRAFGIRWKIMPVCLRKLEL